VLYLPGMVGIQLRKMVLYFSQKQLIVASAID